jgi:hypothetical protein
MAFNIESGLSNGMRSLAAKSLSFSANSHKKYSVDPICYKTFDISNKAIILEAKKFEISLIAYRKIKFHESAIILTL